MRHFAQKLAAVIAFGVLATSFATSCLADEIQWMQDIEKARLAAARQNKLLLIHFWTPTCGPCKSIDRNVFPDQSVVRTINQNFIPIKVNAAETQALSNHFGVQRWPTDVISTVDGKSLHQMVTDQNAIRYARKLGTLAHQHALAAQYRPQQQSVASAGRSPQATNRSMQPPNHAQQTQLAKSTIQPPVSQRRAMGQPNYSASKAQADMSPVSPSNARANMNMTAQSTGRARKPGVDPSKRPGTGLGVNRPSQITPRFAPATPSQPPATQNVASSNPTPQQPVNNYTPLISNPYAAQQAMSQPPSSTAPQQQYNSTAPPAQPPVQQYAAQQRAAQPTRQPGSVAQQQPRYESPTPQPPAPGATGGSMANQPTQFAQASQPAVQAAQQQPRPSDDITPIPPAKNPVLGLEGRCPVWLIDNGSWKKGNQQWGAVHRGVTYLFSSKDAQDKFLASPDDYSPVLAGMDVVRLAANGMVNQGTRQYGVLFDDDGKGPRKSRMFLFDSVETRNLFEAEPDRYLQPVMQAMQAGQLDRLVR